MRTATPVQPEERKKKLQAQAEDYRRKIGELEGLQERLAQEFPGTKDPGGLNAKIEKLINLVARTEAELITDF